MIIAIPVFVGLVALIAAALRFDRAVRDAEERFRVVIGGYGDAGLLAEARRRFRRRQRRVEDALDTGTVGVESAHRTISRLFGGREGQGAGAYNRVRAFNRGIGRAVSGWLAPGPRRRSESLEEWRTRQDGAADDDTRD